MNNQFDFLINKYATAYNVPFAVIKGIIHQETNGSFNSNSAGDPCGKTRGTRKFNCPDNKHCSFGLGQANWCSGTAQSFWNVSNYKELFDPEINIKGIANYLSYQYKRYGNWIKAVSAYNAGSYTNSNSDYTAKAWNYITKYQLEQKSIIPPDQKQPVEPGMNNNWIFYIIIGIGVIITIYIFKNR